LQDRHFRHSSPVSHRVSRKIQASLNTVYLRVAMMGRCSMMGAFLWWGCLTW
jgi:hypothetical protein